MLVTAFKNVNIRLNNASTEASCFGYIPIGRRIEVSDIIIGKEIEGNSIWYKTKEGQFYWSGGFEPTKDILLCNGQPYQLPDATLHMVYESAVCELTGWFQDQFKSIEGLGVGHNDDDFSKPISLLVYVESKTKLLLDVNVPASIGYRGVKLNIEVVETGGINALVHKDIGEPIDAGGGTLEEVGSGSFGTRTALVYTNSPEKCYILTCYHVACAIELKQKILACNSGSKYVINIPSKFSKSMVARAGKVTEGYLDAQFDYALIAIDENDWVNNSIPFVGAINNYYKIPEIKSSILIEKSFNYYGAKSNRLIPCKVKAVRNDAVKVKFEGITINMYGLVACTTVALNGDSGAPVVDATGKLLGYVVAADKKSTYVLPFASLSYEKNLNLSI